jgi:hypothetical protein
MKILSVVNFVANCLRELNPDMDVLVSAIDPKEYIPTTQQITVLIHYCGSVFAASESTDAIIQRQTLHFTATVIVPLANDAINALDRIRNSLGGIPLPDCDRLLWLENEKSLGETMGFCRYTLGMATSTLFIAERESEDLPLLTIVNYKEIQ